MKTSKLFYFFLALVPTLFLSSCKVNITDSGDSGAPQLYLLSYLPNGAQGEILEDEIFSGESFTVKENPYEIPQDKKFAYWNSRRDGRGTSYAEGETIKMPRHDLYLFAHWIDCTEFSIIYKNCDDTDNSANPGEFSKTENVNLVPAVKTGYIFGGWYLTDDFSGEDITGWAAGDKRTSVTLYAKWTPELRSVTYKAGKGSGSDINFEVDYDSSLELMDSSFTAPKNKKFVSWNINGKKYKPGESYEPVHEDLIITAEYDYFVSGDVSKSAIVINGKSFDNTAEVCVVPPVSSYLIEGSDSMWSQYIWEGDHNDFKGAFVNGRNVSLSPYSVSKFMVTRELFKAVFDNLCRYDLQTTADSEDSELVAAGGISWYVAIAFCNKLTLLSGGTIEDLVYSVDGVDWMNLTLADVPTTNNTDWDNAVCDIKKGGYRILTEAEWEFAARGGNKNSREFKYAYPGFTTSKKLTYSKEDGDALGLENDGYTFAMASKSSLNNWSLATDDAVAGYAWLNINSSDIVHQTGLLKPNTLGIYDMAGNLWEWVWDRYAESPSAEDDLYKNENGVVVNPMGATTGNYRIRKGCNYQSEWGLAIKAASGYRGERMEEYKNGPNYGLRIGRSLVE